MIQDVVTASIRIRATPEEVFPYLTDPELLPLWLGEWADTDPHLAGASRSTSATPRSEGPTS